MYISCSCSGPPHALYVCGFRSCCSYKFISLHWTCACTSCLQVHLLALCLRMQSMYASSSPWTMPTHTVCATMQLGRRYCCHREDQVSKDSTTHLDLTKLKESLFAQSAKRQENKTFIGRALARPQESCYAGQKNLAVYDHAVVDFPRCFSSRSKFSQVFFPTVFRTQPETTGKKNTSGGIQPIGFPVDS